MPSRYTNAQKQEALRLLAVHQYNVPIVQNLTGISLPTLYRWRRREFSKDPDLMTQKNIPSIDNHSHKTESPPPPDHPEAELIQDGDADYHRLPTGQVVAKLSDEEREQLKENNVPDPADDSNTPTSTWTPPQRPPVGVPGKTYPYPLEEDEETRNNFDDFRKVRDILMDHAHQLATNLKPDDPDINRRSLALSRILDRVHQLDEMLPDLNPESVLRFEYVYDGQVHNIAPWEASEEYLEKQLKWVREQKAREARGGFDNGSSTT